MPEAVHEFALSPNALPPSRPGPYKVGMSRWCEDVSTGETGLRQMLGEMRPELLRFMLVRGCDPAEVEDLLQDLYVKLSTTRTGPVNNPRAYLYQMANNLLHDHRRGRRRSQARDDHWTRNRVGPDLEKDAGPSPEDSAIARDELRRVNAALALMPQRTAQILKLYRLDGLSQKAIANSLDLSLSAVEKHLQRAYHGLLRLREDLDGLRVREELDGTPQRPQKEADDVRFS